MKCGRYIFRFALCLVLLGLPLTLLAQDVETPLVRSLVDAALQDVSRQVGRSQARSTTTIYVREETLGTRLGCPPSQNEGPAIPGYVIEISLNLELWPTIPEKFVFTYHARLDGTRMFECKGKETER